MRPLAITIVLALMLVPGGFAKKKKAKAGTFDYYLLSLSWSPEHCSSTHDTSMQCTGPRKFGFVVHGLWPNANNGNHPQNCAGPPYDPSFATKDLLDVMPSTDLIMHEWEKHGTCSGLAPKDYFAKILDAFALITVPAEFKGPDHQVEIAPADLRQKFASANADFPLSSFAVSDNGRFLQEMRVCLTKEFKAMACIDKGDTKNRTIIMRPVR